MSSKKLITVFGATGAQGGTVVNALLKDGTFAVRAITRKPTSEKAKDLEKRGVQIFQADIAGPMEKLTEAMKGSYGAFLMTNFWDPSQMQNEEESGEKLIEAARLAGVKEIVWSTLTNVKKISNGKYTVPHFTSKAEVEEKLRDLMSKSPKPFEHVCFVAPSFYFENFENFMPPKKEGDTWVFTMPMTKTLTAFDVNEMGPAVLACFKNPTKYNMKRIDFFGENSSPEQYVKTWEKVTGKKARLNMLPMEEFEKSGAPAAHEFAQMFGWFNEYTFYGNSGDPRSGQEASGGLCNFETYLRRKNPTTA